MFIKLSFNKVTDTEFKGAPPPPNYNTLGYQYSVVLSDSPVQTDKVCTCALQATEQKS